MARTTLNLDAPVLAALKRLQRRENKPMGQLVSELVAEALSLRESGRSRPAEFVWTSRPMGMPAVDLEDRDALSALLDE